MDLRVCPMHVPVAGGTATATATATARGLSGEGDVGCVSCHILARKCPSGVAQELTIRRVQYHGIAGDPEGYWKSSKSLVIYSVDSSKLTGFGARSSVDLGLQSEEPLAANMEAAGRW
jgi:hypothetical protein